jgi:hypothetical protein
LRRDTDWGFEVPKPPNHKPLDFKGLPTEPLRENLCDEIGEAPEMQIRDWRPNR